MSDGDEARAPVTERTRWQRRLDRAALSAAVARYVPATAWMRRYALKDLRPDLQAGLTSWAVMVPVAVAYAALAGLPPEYGLVTAFTALAAYGLFATSRHLKVTASSTMAIMSASVVAPIAGGDVSTYLASTAALALIVGIVLIVAGVLRLGFISAFLSRPVVTGFITGVAISVIIGQLPRLLGVPSAPGGDLEELLNVARSIPEGEPLSLVLGLGALLMILLAGRIDRRIPGALIAIALGIGLTKAFDLEEQGVAVVGAVATLTPSVGLPDISLSAIPYLLTGSIGIAFLAMGESLGGARSFAQRHRYEIDADQELVALGAANLASGAFGGFVADASLSQSATGEAAGTRTQLPSLVTSGLILLTSLYLAWIFADLPTAVLGAIIIAAVLGLIDVPELRRYWAMRRPDFALAMAALVGVVLTDVLTGLLIAVLLSLVLLLYRASRPYLAVLGRLEGAEDVYVDRSRHTTEPVPGLLLARMDAPLYFFNASVARTQLLAMVDDSHPRPRTVIVGIGASADLDVTAADTISQLITDLESRGVSLALAGVRGSVRDRLGSMGLMDRIGKERVYLTMPQAVAFERQRAEDGEGGQEPGRT